MRKMLSRVENNVTEISRLFSTLTLYTQKLKVANARIKNFLFGIKCQVLN
jgi:DNA polymerase III delta subunit